MFNTYKLTTWMKIVYKQKKSIIPAFILFVLLSAVYLGHTWTSSISGTREKTLKIAETAEASINGVMARALTASASDEGTTAYKSIKRRLTNIAGLYKNVRFVYIYTHRNGSIYISADSEPAGSKDYSPPGQEYTEANSEFINAFKAGKAFITKPVTDRWGKWISILVPMKDVDTGVVYAVFGMDYPAEIWNREAEQNTLQAVVVVLTVFLLIIAYFIIIFKNNELKEEQRKIALSEERYKSVSAVSNTGAWEYDLETDYVWCSPEYFTMLGYEPGDFKLTSGNLNEVWTDLLHPDDRESAAAAFQSYITGEAKGMYDNHVRMKRKDGGWSWIWSRGRNLRDENGKPTSLTVGTHIDVTHIKKIEQALYTEKEQFKTTLLSVGDGVISTDTQGNVLLINRVAEELTGWNQAEAVGRPLNEVFRIINEQTRESCENPVYKVLATGETYSLEEHTLLVSRHGQERPIEDSAAPIRNEQGNISGAVLVFRDFTEKKEKLDRIFYLSFYDQLTGLYNRRFFEEELKRLDTARNLPLTLVLLDVNGLKLANDAFGHMVGDRVLRKVAEILKNECRADDIIARIGGDEFVILLPKTDSSNAEIILKRIHDSIINEKVESINLSVSYGWETKLDADDEMSKVFKKAEDHMYRHKLYESTSMRYETITVILKTLYEKNKREEKHSKRVSHLCTRMGTALNLSQTAIRELGTAGLMHDIGKIAISEDILNKVSPLSDTEWLEIKRHPEIGYNILRSVNEYAHLAEFVLAHHERWDGTGYPKGLKGSEIPLQSRIIAIVDAYDAMTGYRTYRKALSSEEAVTEIRRSAGTQFDPEIVSQAFSEAGIKKLFQL